MKNVKGIKVRKTLVMVLVLMLLASTLAFAESDVEVRGYLSEGLSEEEIQQAKAQFTVSNVIDILNINKYDEMNHLLVQSPSVVTLMDEPYLLEAYRVDINKEGDFDYDFEYALDISGNVLAHLFDPVTEESTVKAIDASETKNHKGLNYVDYQVGNTISLTEPGYYHVVFRYEAIAGSTETLIQVVDEVEEVEKIEDIEEKTEEKIENLSAKSSDSKVVVNNEEIEFDAYNINANNYFKLRDLAKAVNGSEKQFDVIWNGEKSAIELLTNQEYTMVGGELEKGDNTDKLAVTNRSKIYKDGEEIELSAYTINENNYFKLRDIAKVFDIGVTWNQETKTVGIDTSLGYTE